MTTRAEAQRKAGTRNLRILIERPEVCTFWGQSYTITPRLIARIFGDGGRLLCVTPMATRPNYFVVRVDSALHDPRDPMPGSDVSLLEEIMCAAEEEYGTFGDDEERDANGDERRPFPVTDWGIGASWGKPFSVVEWTSMRTIAGAKP